MDKLLGQNWKGVTGAIGMIALGVAQVADCFVPDLLEQDSTIAVAFATISAGLAALGIRGAVGRDNKK